MAPKRNNKKPIENRSVRQCVTNSTNNNGTTTIEVPTNMAQQLIDLLQTLSVNQTSSNSAGCSTDNPPLQAENTNMACEPTGERLYEVTNVVDHRVVNGQFQFLLRFKGFSEPEWIDDEMCECTEIVNSYLKTKNIKTIYIICRVSTVEQAGDAHMSLAAQEVLLRQHMGRFAPYQRIRVHRLTQSAFKKMPLTLAELGRYAVTGDVIMVWRVDRLSRNVAICIEWLDQLHSRGVTIYAQFENITFAERRLDFLQSIIHAEREAENTGHRVRMSIAHRRNRGDEHVGTLAYGKMYRDELDDNNTLIRRRVVPNPRETHVINQIRSAIHNRTHAQIAADLNQRGILKRNKLWTAAMVSNIRRRPIGQ